MLLNSLTAYFNLINIHFFENHIGKHPSRKVDLQRQYTVAIELKAAFYSLTISLYLALLVKVV
ncbi:hypothetical protein GCM10027217_12260 [Pseudomaricurvus hydrocarbonicus]